MKINLFINTLINKYATLYYNKRAVCLSVYEYINGIEVILMDHS